MEDILKIIDCSEEKVQGEFKKIEKVAAIMRAALSAADEDNWDDIIDPVKQMKEAPESLNKKY